MNRRNSIDATLVTTTISTRKKSIISFFLAAVLVVGTMTAFYPSSFTPEVHALSDYGKMMMTMDDNKYKSSKYSSLKKDNIECNNLNFNLNALDIDAIPESLRSLLASQAQTEGEEEGTEIGSGTYGNGKDLVIMIKTLNLYV